jgi:hypothetical protein
MNSATFLHDCAGIITGKGFKRVIPGLGINELTEADGDTLDNGSTPPMAALETNGYGVAVANNTTFAGCLNFVIPQDYDESDDELKIRILGATVGGTDSGDTMDCTAYRKRGGVALGSDLNPSVSGAMAATAVLADWVEIDLSDNSLQGGDVLHVTLSTSAHATDPVHIYAIEVQYRSCLVYFDKADR